MPLFIELHLSTQALREMSKPKILDNFGSGKRGFNATWPGTPFSITTSIVNQDSHK
jgi:hypothetical protein